ncbi:hypothetical protein NQZ68_011134 [Dissostichus eleginoides]|nr:hypothetical protein NQZ68_011134 [Dissostichus eleginoides]
MFSVAAVHFRDGSDILSLNGRRLKASRGRIHFQAELIHLTTPHFIRLEAPAGSQKTLTQLCCSTQRHQVGEMASDLMNVAALGRPFTLGMLYDARKDELVPG